MHPGQVESDPRLVRRLLQGQFPRWAGLPVARVRHHGTDNAVYRLGDELAVRLPLVGWAARQAELEQAWLPVLAPHLPVAVPAPIAVGRPAEGYPFAWWISPWLAGEDASEEVAADPLELAREVAGFISALQAIPAGAAPAAPRGRPLAELDARLRADLQALAAELDTRPLLDIWEAALQAPPWPGAPVWQHGDLSPGNLLLRGGRLAAVIDWGALGCGDPAGELTVAWTLFSSGPRAELRRSLVGLDAATWTRARGWALSVAAAALPYYRHTNPGMVARARRVFAELADLG